MSNPSLHRSKTAAAALAFAATVTLSLLSTISILADRYHAEALVAQTSLAVAQPSTASAAQPRS
jgi:hypothetical protein